MNKKPIVVNFYGGPGTGKSTLSASIFSELKFLNLDVELVTEYAKKKVWEEAYKVFECQLYVCSKQVYNMFCVSKHVDIIVTDSPIIMGCAYTNGDEMLDDILVREHKLYNNIEIFLNRKKAYNPKGRYQTEDEAREKDGIIKNILNKNKINFLEIDGDKSSVNNIVEHILSEYEKTK